MQDSRIAKIADVLVNYSTRLGPGEKVAIMGPPLALPLMVELYRYALRAGAHPTIACQPSEANEILLKEGSDEQLTFVPPVAKLIIEEYDCRIAIVADRNTKALSNIPPGRQVLRAKAMQPIADLNMSRLTNPEDSYRWVGALFPTNAHAQDASMSLAEYGEFVLNACLPSLDVLPEDAKAFIQPGADPADPTVYWETFSRWQGCLVAYLEGKRELHVVGPHIDLRLGIAGRHWWNADGHVNFPDGEVFTGPIEDSVEGWVAFTYPAIYRGNEVKDVRLQFEQGRVVHASANHGEAFLLDMLNSDEGARRLGEFAIGTNPNITQFTGHTLFDEKIKGTCHMALGRSIPGTGGVNQSAIHWDMVCDLRQDSRIYADGELLYENGEFVVPFADQANEAMAGSGKGSMGVMFGT